MAIAVVNGVEDKVVRVAPPVDKTLPVASDVKMENITTTTATRYESGAFLRLRHRARAA